MEPGIPVKAFASVIYPRSNARIDAQGVESNRKTSEKSQSELDQL